MLLALVTVAKVVGRAAKVVLWTALETAAEVAMAATELTDEATTELDATTATEEDEATTAEEAATVDAGTAEEATAEEADPDPDAEPTVKSTQDS